MERRQKFRLDEQIIWINTDGDVMGLFAMLIAAALFFGLVAAILLFWQIFLKLKQNSDKFSRKTYLLHVQFTVLLLLQVTVCFNGPEDVRVPEFWVIDFIEDSVACYLIYVPFLVPNSYSIYLFPSFVCCNFDHTLSWFYRAKRRVWFAIYRHIRTFKFNSYHLMCNTLSKFYSGRHSDGV